MRYHQKTLKALGIGGLLAAIALALALAQGSLNPAHTPNRVVPGEMMPDLAFTELSGASRRLSELRGRPVVILSWATWHPQSAAQLGIINEFIKKHPQTSVAVLALTSGESAAAVHNFMRDQSASVPIMLDPGGTAQRALGLTALPTFFFITPDGRLDDRLERGTTPDELNKKLGELSAQP